MTVHFTRGMLAIALLLTFLTDRPTMGQPPAPDNPVAQAAKNQTAYGRHSTSVLSVAFSPDGKRVASAGGDRIKSRT